MDGHRHPWGAMAGEGVGIEVAEEQHALKEHHGD